MANLAQMEQELIVERTRAVAGSRDRTRCGCGLQSAEETITFTGEGRIFSCASLRTGERILPEASQAECISCNSSK
jgi:hypothetical protein